MGRGDAEVRRIGRVLLPVGALALVALALLPGERPSPSRPAPAPPLRVEPPAATDPNLLAERRYERLRRGARDATIHVRWFRAVRDGRPIVRDVTRTRSRAVRLMGNVSDVFESDETATALRTDDGDLISMESRAVQGDRTDAVDIERVEAGYDVRVAVGENEDRFTIPSAEPAKLDAEAFLSERVRRGEARPGTTWTYAMLDVGKRRVERVTLEVEGPDDEGPGLKVVETHGEARTIWWFDGEGAIARLRMGDVVVRRDDRVALDDVPVAPASFSVTLPCDHDLPRIFTTRAMVVELRVETDDTVRVPTFAASPFTEEVGRAAGSVRLRLLSHDDPAATCALPVAGAGFEPFLKATPFMEVGDPEVVAAAREAVGDETDGRRAAARIAAYVFQRLTKASPDIGQLTAREILRRGEGDCSEHAMLFCALCRAAGIPTRACSGYVCIGSDWGAHSWCEIWIGTWIGADPTTAEIGTRARYILCSREEDHDRPPASIVPERSEIRILRAEYPDGALDFASGTKVSQKVLSGIRVKLPNGDWRARWRSGGATIEGPGLVAMAHLYPDHGYREIGTLLQDASGGESDTFGGRPAVRWGDGAQWIWIVPLGRELLRVDAQTDRDELDRARLEKILAPTLAPGGE